MKTFFILFYLIISFTSHISFAQNDWPSGPLMVNKNESNWKDYAKVGTIATAPEICKIFTHPFFRHKVKDYDELKSISSSFVWDGIEASSLWVYKKFNETGVITNRGSLFFDERTSYITDGNLTACLKFINEENPNMYKVIKYKLLTYLKDECLEQKFRVKKSVDDSGNISEERIPLKKVSCIDFRYNSARFSNWNSTTFALMLVWKEAHPILNKIFDKGQSILNARLIERDKKNKNRELADAKIKAQREKAFKNRKKSWLDYSSREKKIMEEVYNFSSTGNPNGGEYNYWVEVKPCVLTNGKKTIDNRKINMTAFRIYSDTNVNYKPIMVSSDGNVYFATTAKIPSDRLRRAWKLAFEKCPGKTSKF